jgi:Beta protein
MTFGPDHYVPVLKVKRGEKLALKQLAARLQSRITPLLEIVERQPDKSVAEHLDTAFNGLAESVRAYPRSLLDARELASDGPLAAVEVFRRARLAGFRFTPVTGISRNADTSAALDHRDHGLALRLTRVEFEQGDLTERLHNFLQQYELQAEEIDLIIDIGPVEDLVVEGIASLTNLFMAGIPDHGRWRTFTLSACAFPLSMALVDRQSHDFVERADWIAWRDQLHQRRRSLIRTPTFSDCAIQHPRGVEGFDPRIMQVSASVRYTLPEQWLLVKGESTRFRQPSVQFPELATRLAYGHLRSHFRGENHCEGCALIKAAADGAPRFGSAEAWRRLGTMHHISTVVEQLDLLPST